MEPVLPLVEVFHSVQGEGKNAGRAAVFIRLSGCNCSCVFADGSICDTPWQKARSKMPLSQVLDYVHARLPKMEASLPVDPRMMVVITGGEPTIARDFDALVYALRRLPVYIAVESNGTTWRESLLAVDHLTVSPKNLPTIGAFAQHRPDLSPEVLRLPPHEWRFVITGRDDPTPPYYEGGSHYVSPALLADGTGTEWQDPGYQPRFAPGAVERCIEIVQQDPRWRLSLQTHKWLRVR